MDKKELISLFILAFIDQSSKRYETDLSDYYDNEQGFPGVFYGIALKVQKKRPHLRTEMLYDKPVYFNR